MPFTGKQVLAGVMGMERAYRATKPRRSPEHDEQAALIQWARLNSHLEPRLKWLFAIPNGAHLSKAQAGKLKAEGLTSGVFDLFLPVVGGRGSIAEDAPGLWIEMKSKNGRPSKEQREFETFVGSQGYSRVICHSWTDAARHIVSYLRQAGGTLIKAP